MSAIFLATFQFWHGKAYIEQKFQTIPGFLGFVWISGGCGGVRSLERRQAGWRPDPLGFQTSEKKQNYGDS